MKPSKIHEHLWQITQKKIDESLSALIPREILYIPNRYQDDAKSFQDIDFFLNARNQNKRFILELGSGWGEWLNGWLTVYPHDHYLAFEGNQGRVRSTIKKNYQFTKNYRIALINFQWFLTEILPPHFFDLIFILFPDPWPKKKHWKKRFVQNDFDQKMIKLLKKEKTSRIYITTDYRPYAEKINCHLEESPLLVNTQPTPFMRTRPTELIKIPNLTFFEKKCQDQQQEPYWFSYASKEMFT